MPSVFAAAGGEPSTLDELGALGLSDWLWAAGLLTGAVLLAIVANRLVVKLASPPLAPLVARLVGRVAAALVFGLGFVYALQQVGVSVAPLLGVLGLFGLALAFAFQEVLENVIAGIFMSLRRPFAQGDEISTADHDGVVDDIRIRAVTLRTYDGRRVYVPNSQVWTNPIVNHTELGSRRTTLDIGVGYDTDLEATTALLEQVVAGVDGVLGSPEPQALVHGFGDSSIDVAIRYWHEPSIATLWRVRDRVAKAVKRALDDAGVDIPFPQRVVAISGEIGRPTS